MHGVRAIMNKVRLPQLPPSVLTASRAKARALAGPIIAEGREFTIQKQYQAK
jgi:hypothetical protein